MDIQKAATPVEPSAPQTFSDTAVPAVASSSSSTSLTAGSTVTLVVLLLTSLTAYPTDTTVVLSLTSLLVCFFWLHHYNHNQLQYLYTLQIPQCWYHRPHYLRLLQLIQLCWHHHQH